MLNGTTFHLLFPTSLGQSLTVKLRTAVNTRSAHGMSKVLAVGSHSAYARLNPPGQRRSTSASPRQSQPLRLTVRSVETPSAPDFNAVLSSLDSQKLELLQNVDEESYQQLAQCAANVQLQPNDMATLLLRVTEFHRVWCERYAEDDRDLCDISRMITKIVLLTKILAAGSSEHVVQTVTYVLSL